MPTRAPGEHPAEGETIQEHDLEHRRERRDRQTSDQDQQSPTKPKAPNKETWRDWFPNAEPTLTVDELLTELQDSGIDVDRSTLRFWQKEGILPHPERRRIGTGTYAMYPPVAMALISDIRNMQARGSQLKVIKPWIRGIAITLQQPDPLGLSKPVTAAARQHEERTGEKVERAVVTFTDSEGTETSYVVSILDE